MGKFANGFWLGLGCSLLLTPMSGQDMRNLLKERLQHLRGSLPAQPTIEKPTQAEQTVSPAAKNPLASSSHESLAAVPTEVISQTHSLNQVTGMNEKLRAKLQSEGISSIEQLTKKTATKEERTELAQRVGISAQQLKTLANYADLSHINGLGENEAILLEEAGVNGSKDLQQRNPEHLHAKLLEVQNSRHLIAHTPDLDQVAMWIAEAKEATSHE